MAGIILTILKIIGIILLVVIVCVLLLVATILFYPVSYRINAEKGEEITQAQIYASWLFRIFRFRLFYNSKEDLIYDLKILFFQILPKKEKADKKKKDGNTRRKKISDLEDNSEVKEDTTNTSSEETSKSDSKKASSEKKEIPQEYKVKKEQLPKASDFLEVIKKKIIKVKFTFEKICDKIKEIFSGYEKFKEFISSEETKETLRCLNTQRKYLFHHLKPDKSDLYLHFGTEDPATTGEVLALLSLVYPFYPWNLNVEPDFEQVCLDGKLKIKGKIQVYVLLITLWRLYQNENIKKFMKTVTQ